MEKKEEAKKEQPEEIENDATHKKLVKFFDDNHAQYTLKTHPAAKTAEEAAVFRSTPLCSGAKSMLVKDNSKSSVKDLVLYRFNC